MSWTNYHCHSAYCDGKETIEAYIQSAIQKNMRAIGFSSHTPLPFFNSWSMQAGKLEMYFAELSALKEKYAGQIDVHASLETDFISGVWNTEAALLNTFPMDYSLCSVHFLGQFSDGSYGEIDGPTLRFSKALKEIWGNDPEALVQAYFEAFAEMLAVSQPTIIGHFDKLKIHRNEQGQPLIDTDSIFYKEQALRCLERIAASSSFLEINTRAMYKKNLPEPYPAWWMIEAANDMGIPFVLNSDSHHPSEVDKGFSELVPLLKQAGINTLQVLSGTTWQPCEFNQHGFLL